MPYRLPHRCPAASVGPGCHGGIGQRKEEQEGRESASPHPGDLCAEEQGSPVHGAESGDARGAAGCRFLEGFFPRSACSCLWPTTHLLPPPSPPQNPKTTLLGFESRTGCPAPTERRLPVTHLPGAGTSPVWLTSLAVARRTADIQPVLLKAPTAQTRHLVVLEARRLREDRARVDLRRRHRKCATVTRGSVREHGRPGRRAVSGVRGLSASREQPCLHSQVLRACLLGLQAGVGGGIRGPGVPRRLYRLSLRVGSTVPGELGAARPCSALSPRAGTTGSPDP
ncbi:uncharacterized protein LOC122907500 [Neovison vison]|uniref:uncharacterized protein LOC122907500 n=1 Tax=Neovison vison TaxID=452646 RepID=UPI001CF01746|nr:uncharacterized protein LOC122907500 [Neogale vison]